MGSKKVRTQQGPRDVQFEADAVPINADGKVIALGSCKWSVNEHGADEFGKLEQIAGMLERDNLVADSGITYLFFDKTGFSDRLRELEEERDDVRLIMTSEL